MDFELDEDALMYGEHTARSADVSDEELESGACGDDGVSSNADTDTVDNMDRETGLSVGAGSSGVPPIPEHEVSLGGMERRTTAIAMTSRIKFDEASSCEPIGGVKMGSSAPISIPGLKARSNSSNAPPNLDNPKLMATTFVPPHMMETGEFGYGWDGASPSAVLKKDKLRVRNAVLRSTGFLADNQEAIAAQISAMGGSVAHGSTAGLPLASGGLKAAMAAQQ